MRAENVAASVSRPSASDGPIGVGAVGVWPGLYDGILAALPQGEQYRLVAFSDEGLPGSADAEPDQETAQEPDEEAVEEFDEQAEEGPPASAGEGPAGPCYPDYNVMLQDPAVEMVLVDGLVELRRDFAVRALNAGRHVVLAPPFCESAADAERVAKTAMRSKLVATMDLPWRDDPDLQALLAALEAESAGRVWGAFLFLGGRELPEPAESSAPRPGLLEQVGQAALGQMHLVLSEDVRSISAHLHRPAPEAPDEGFLLYLPLRKGGWAVCQASRNERAGLPRWVVYAGQTAVTVNGGAAVAVTADGGQRTYRTSEQRADFWQNLYAAVREGAELKCHPADIVRAMKHHEAAMSSAELGEPVTI